MYIYVYVKYEYYFIIHSNFENVKLNMPKGTGIQYLSALYINTDWNIITE